MSPAGASSLEDQQYMEKWKQLSKYIEPLRRMINKIDKNEGEGATGTKHRAPPPVIQSQSSIHNLSLPLRVQTGRRTSAR